MGAQNVIADSLSRQHQVLGSEWTLTQDVINSLLTWWPATVLLNELPPPGLLFSSRRSDVGGHRCISADVGGAPGIRLPSLRPDVSGAQQAARLQGNFHHLDGPLLAAESVVPGAPESGCGSSGTPSTSEMFSDNCISIACTRTSPCFDFMLGDYSTLRPHSRSLTAGSSLSSRFIVASPRSGCTSTACSAIGPGAIVRGIPSLPLLLLR